jgi:hypothetical protein
MWNGGKSFMSRLARGKNGAQRTIGSKSNQKIAKMTIIL